MTLTESLTIQHALRNEADYNAAVAEVERLFGAEPGTAAAERFLQLASLVEAYEKQHHAIDAPTADAMRRYENEKRVSLAAA